MAQVPHLCGLFSLPWVSSVRCQHPQFHFCFSIGFMSLCHVIVTMLAVGGKSVCRGQNEFQMEREVADQGIYVG